MSLTYFSHYYQECYPQGHQMAHHEKAFEAGNGSEHFAAPLAREGCRSKLTGNAAAQRALLVKLRKMGGCYSEIILIELTEDEKVAAQAASKAQREAASAAGRSLLEPLPTPNAQLTAKEEDAAYIWRLSYVADASGVEEQLRPLCEKWAGNEHVLGWLNMDPSGYKHKGALYNCNALLAASKRQGPEKGEIVLKVLRLLLSAGFDVDSKDRFGKSALMMAAIENQPTWARLLIDEGANVNLKQHEGKTAMTYAVDWKAAEIIAMLEAAGVKKN